MTMLLTLWCGVFAEGIVFSVDVHQNATVESLQEAIVRKKRDVNVRFRVDPSKLKLYLARKKGETTWLKDGLSTDSLLQQGGTVNIAQFEEMRPLWKLYTDNLFGRNFVPGDDEIQILVELPSQDDGSRKRSREDSSASADVPNPQRLRRDKEPCAGQKPSPEATPSIHIQDSPYVTLPVTLLAKCGYIVANDVMLYCRRGVRELWDFVLSNVLQLNARGFILGPPGVGKSMATLSVLLSLDQAEWNVVWIHLSDLYDTCLSFGSNEYSEIEDLSTFQLPRVSGKKLVVCLDNYSATEAHEQFCKRVLTYLDKQTERLVVCSTNSTSSKRSQSVARVKNVQYYTMYSWTLDEYVAAVANPTFYDKIASKLDQTSRSEVSQHGTTDVELDEEEKKTRAVELKFYYAGGSCRYMFEYAMDEVATGMVTAIDAVMNPFDLIYYCTRSGHHNEAIDHLFGLECHGDEKTRFPVSAHVALWFAKVSNQETTMEVAKRLYNAPRYSSLIGHLNEWMLFASLQISSSLCGNGRAEYLPPGKVVAFEPNTPFEVLADGTIEGSRRWLTPIRRRQGSYDALYFDHDNGQIIFLQFSRSKESVFRMRFFYQVLCSLRTAGVAIKKVKICFVMNRAFQRHEDSSSGGSWSLERV
ncbi:hypothetical protein PINS_up003395 [Pythium insidiosum]|nr:hypothetical protein PINS_up003395 [Pythium insidiosum]